MLVPTSTRDTIFITHAAPEDNEFALWISSKLAIAGYKVWVDRRRLRGGDDSWDEIDRVLRTQAIKQVVVFTKHVQKSGVKKELAIGDAMKAKLSDPNFMIGIRNDNTDFYDAPPELLRGNILNSSPNWHDCLKPLLDTLEEAKVPTSLSPESDILRTLIEAREDGRRFIVDRAEEALTNWFPITAPPKVRYFLFDGTQHQMKAWLADCRVPYVSVGRLAGTFFDLDTFAAASSFQQRLSTSYEVNFPDFVTGVSLGPYIEKRAASNDIVNLLRQHFAIVAGAKGLLPTEFANGEVGWFFPDGLVPNNRITFDTPDNRRVRRTVSGKFKKLRWHLCIVAKPRIWPELVYRIHANVVLSEDGKTPLTGDQTHRRRIRLTKSWWNDVWRDRLLAAMNFLASGDRSIQMEAGANVFQASTWPVMVDLKASYDATDPPLPVEEDDDGNIIPSAALDEFSDEQSDDHGEDE